MQKLLFIVCSFWLSSTFAQGVSDTEIKLGVSNAQSGPAAALGSGVLEGAKVYLDSLNANGGVNGRKVNLVVYDDAYEPKKTIENTAKLIEQDKVLALVGYVGTPTSKAILPLIGKNKVPYIAPLTGAEFLRNPVNPNVFNIRASYFDETEALVNGMVADLGAKKIGIFVQDDGYGDAGKSGVVRALRKKGLKLAGEGRYTRNTLDVDAGLDVLMKAKPDAIILVGAYKPCAAFIKKAKAKGFAPHFANISFVGTKNLIEELGGAGEGSFISQAIPSPESDEIAVIKEYHEAMNKAGKSPSYNSLEGYLGMKFFSQALKAAGKDLNRDSLVKALNSQSFKVGSENISWSAKSHSGLKKVFLTKIKGNKAVPVNKLND